MSTFYFCSRIFRNIAVGIIAIRHAKELKNSDKAAVVHKGTNNMWVHFNHFRTNTFNSFNIEITMLIRSNDNRTAHFEMAHSKL